MKFRFIKTGAVFMAAMMAVLGSHSVRAQAVTIQAGVSAALTEYMNESTKAASSGPQKEAKAVKKTRAQKKIRSIGKQNDNASEEKTICGYKNLGIANVDNYLNVRQEPGEDAKIVGKLPADFVEGMVCVGGCVGGPSKHKSETEAKKARDLLIGQADSREVHENLRNLGASEVAMHRH